ncbi:MAG: glycosyltransferase [Caulobacterales bacterium]
MIVEIGDRPVIASALPDETAFFSTVSPEGPPPPYRRLGSLAALWRALNDPAVSLIVCHPTFSAPWSLRHLSRALFARRALKGRVPLLRAFGPQLLRFTGRAPVVVLDFEDLPVINTNTLFLLDRCQLFFKRELPADHWRVFLKTAHANLPTPRFRNLPRQRARIAKLAPLSLGLPLDWASVPEAPSQERTSDVFFAGRIEGSSSLRARGLAELRALAAQGLRIDLPDAPLPREAFYRRCAGAWLVWSPEGFGWECFRHYEALASGTVPLINQPSIERHQPLIAGEHALYYDVEPGGLTGAVNAALADKARLTRIAMAGRAHVLGHHTPAAIARHVVAMASNSETRAG